jgi:hypothetical protein
MFSIFPSCSEFRCFEINTETERAASLLNPNKSLISLADMLIKSLPSASVPAESNLLDSGSFRSKQSMKFLVSLQFKALKSSGLPSTHDSNEASANWLEFMAL